jgi:hypothetical protein
VYLSQSPAGLHSELASARVVWPTGHSVHGGVREREEPPREKVEMAHAAQDAPPKPGAHATHALVLVDPAANVVRPLGQGMHGARGLLPVAPGENVPAAQEAQLGPPVPGGHTHSMAMHRFPSGQALPQPPQLLGEVKMLTQLVLALQ